MNGKDLVLFLTDDDLEELLPLRIAHHPGVILEVVVLGDHDNHTLTSLNDGRVDSARSLPASSSKESGSTAGGVASLGIIEGDDSQAPVVHSQGDLPASSTQQNPTLYDNTYQPGPEIQSAQNKKLRLLQQQMECVRRARNLQPLGFSSSYQLEAHPTEKENPVHFSSDYTSCASAA